MKTKNKTLLMKEKLPFFYKATAKPLLATEEYLKTALISQNEDITEAGLYLLNSGGKRLRPGLLLLCAGYGNGSRAIEEMIPVAAAVEMIHMASLVHDDIVDNTPLRRGKPTIAAHWGQETALYTGNFILAQAIAITAQYGDERTRDIAYETAASMCRGEFAQLNTIDTVEFNTSGYLLRIKQKTANLIAAACEVGAYLSGAEKETVAALRSFGENLGIAFQIADDILDYTADKQLFGKATGSDLAEGLATMPLICAWEQGDHKELIRDFFRKKQKTEKDINELITAVLADSGPEEAVKRGKHHIKLAKEAIKDLPDSEFKQGFTEIADFIMTRDI